MKQTLRLLIVLVCATFFWGVARAQSPAQSPDDQLTQMVAQLQKSTNDQALREKIINLVLTLNPKPATPDAATEAEGAAEYAFKNAKVNSDFSDAAKQYEKALLLAPWLAADYFNCGVAYEKAGEDTEAIHSFNLYLLAAPNANDAQAVKKRIGGLQYADQKAEDKQAVLAKQEAEEQAAQVRQAQADEALIKSLDGAVFVYHNPPNLGGQWDEEVHINGGYATVLSRCNVVTRIGRQGGYRAGAIDYEKTHPSPIPHIGRTFTSTEGVLEVAADGQSLTMTPTGRPPLTFVKQ
ncbi:MAG: hypothetical protein ACYDDI_09870 [Candidatus Acidiferrales bacterium]